MRRLFCICVSLFAAAACARGTLPASEAANAAARTGSTGARAGFVFMSGLLTRGKLVSTFAIANGKTMPVSVITAHKGAAFSRSYDLAYDAGTNRIWVTSCVDRHGGRQVDDVLAFDADASGTEVVPEVSIGGGATTLGGCQTGIAIGQNGDVFVADATNAARAPGGEIAVFARREHGDAAPTRRIAGHSTDLRTPEAIAVDKQHLVVADSCIGFGSCSGYVQVFSTNADGDVAPLRQIEGTNTQIARPFGIALDAAGNIYVANRTSIAVFRGDANGDATPLYTIAGGRTRLHKPGAIAVDAAGYLYVGSVDASRTKPYPVLVFAPRASGNAAPVAAIQVETSPWGAPAGIAVK